MMKRKLFLFINMFAALFLFSEEHEIQYVQEIMLSGEKDYKEIVLDKDVITKSSRNFRDIRIVDEAGNNVPYFIYNSFSYSNMMDTSFESEYIGSFIKEEENEKIEDSEIGDSKIYEYFDFRIIKQEHSDVYGNQLKLETKNSGFAEMVEIFGSHDGIHWTPVTEAFMYDVGEISQKTVSFNHIEKYSYYRIKAKEKALQMQSLTLSYIEVTEDSGLFADYFHPVFSIEEKDRNTLITIPKSEIRFLYIDGIHFETKGTFQRELEVFYQYDEIYRFPFRGELLEKNFVTLDRQIPDEDLIVTIYNADDKPLEITNITINYGLQKLVFNAAEGGLFFLEYGDSSLTKPDYDIANYGEYILKEGLDSCVLGEVKERAVSEPKTFFSMSSAKLFMNISIILAAVILLIIIFAGFKKHASS